MMFPHPSFLAIKVINGRFVTRFPMPPPQPEESTWPQRIYHNSKKGRPVEDNPWASLRSYKQDHAE